MIALAILSVTLIVLLGLRNRDVTLSQHASDLSKASMLAQEILVETELEGFPEIGGNVGEFGDRTDQFSWETTVVPTPFEQVREVRIRVMWNEGQRKENVTLVTYVFKEE